MSALADRREAVSVVFRRAFGGEPEIWCRAPGRVDLMGSHTDYNLGWVLTLPIDRDTWIAARRRVDRRVRVRSINLEEEAEIDLAGRRRAVVGRRWSSYVWAVGQVLGEVGYEVGGFDGCIQSTVPMSSGLSSSAALECATAMVCKVLGGWSMDPVRMACLCQKAENDYVGVQCGILDQYTSCVGEEGCALLLDCRDLTSRPVRLAGGLQVVIGDTRFRRELAGSEYGDRRADCESGARLLGVSSLRELDGEVLDRLRVKLPARVGRRCRFIIEENERVKALAEALVTGDRGAIGRLCAASFEGALRLYEIGVPAMEVMREAMLAAPGVVGARQAGAGFGGCLVAVVETAQVEGFCAEVRRCYQAAAGVPPEVYAVTAAAGAGCVPDVTEIARKRAQSSTVRPGT